MSLLYTAPIVKVLLFMSFIGGERIAQLRLGKHRQPVLAWLSYLINAVITG